MGKQNHTPSQRAIIPACLPSLPAVAHVPPVPESAAAGTRGGAAAGSPLLPARSSVCSAERSSHSEPAEAVSAGLPSAAATQRLSGKMTNRRKLCKDFDTYY